MKVVGGTLRFLALVINIFAGIGFLLCAYSPYISPVAHPVWGCIGLAFPFFLLLNSLFVLFWLFSKKKFVFLPLAVFMAGWGAVRTYFPINTEKEPEGGKVIKLLTYNTLGMISEKKVDGKWESPILDYLENSEADIVCLQECSGKDAILKKRLSAKFPYIKMAGGGIACLTKFPILSAERIKYKSADNSSVLFRLRAGKDTLIVINNHLESNKLDAHDKELYKDMLKSPNERKVKKGSKYLLGKLADAAAIRAPQADSVAKAIALNNSKYLLVCGDFNDSPISYAHRVIGKGLQDVYAEGGCGPGISYNQNYLYFRIDHIFAGKGFRVLNCVTDCSISASDHYPVWCLLEKKE